jgi:hypothetical protein
LADLERQLSNVVMPSPHLRLRAYGWCAVTYLSHAETAKDVDDADGGAGEGMNEDECSKCFGNGELLCCDQCPRAYHLSCVGLSAHEAESLDHWMCPACAKAGGRRASGAARRGAGEGGALGGGRAPADVWSAASLGLPPPKPSEEFLAVASIARAGGYGADWDTAKMGSGAVDGGAGAGAGAGARR